MSEGRKTRPQGENRVRHSPLWFGVVARLLTAFLWGWLLLFLILCVAGYDKGYLYAFTKGYQDFLETKQVVEDSLLHEVGFLGEGGSLDLSRVFSNLSSLRLPEWFRIEAERGDRVGKDLLYTWVPKQKESSQAETSFETRLFQIEDSLRGAIVLFCLSGAILVLKGFLLVLALPLFVLAIGVGISDGLMLRTLRRENLGRESAYVFHKLVHVFPRLLGFVLMVYFTLPLTGLSPYALWAIALGVGIWSMKTTSLFKKYV